MTIYKNTIFTLSILSIGLASVSAAAFNYDVGKPMVISYQGSSGTWWACGPNQCLSAMEKSEERSIDLVTQDHHGNFTLIGSYGRCNVYASDGDLKSYDQSPEKIIRRSEKRCSQ